VTIGVSLESIIMKFIALAFLLSLSPLSAVAVDFTIAGLTLGAPLSVPECERRELGTFSPPSTTTCYRDQGRYFSSDLGTPGWKVVTVVLGRDSIPSILNGSEIESYTKNGVLVAVKFSTNGFDSQPRDLKTLIEKYGKPTSRKIEKFQNGFGAKFDGIVAIWRLQGLLVQLNGIYVDRETGLVTVGTPEGVELVNADGKRFSGNKNKL
jgi:hypothetical protein